MAFLLQLYFGTNITVKKNDIDDLLQNNQTKISCKNDNSLTFIEDTW